MKKHLLKLLSFEFAIVICLILIGQHTEAAASDRGFFEGLASALHLEMNKEPAQTEKAALNNTQRIYSKVLPPDTRVQLPLSDHLKLFYNMRPVSKDFYGERDYYRKGLMFGINISF